MADESNQIELMTTLFGTTQFDLKSTLSLDFSRMDDEIERLDLQATTFMAGQEIIEKGIRVEFIRDILDLDLNAKPEIRTTPVTDSFLKSIVGDLLPEVPVLDTSAPTGKPKTKTKSKIKQIVDRFRADLETAGAKFNQQSERCLSDLVSTIDVSVSNAVKRYV